MSLIQESTFYQKKLAINMISRFTDDFKKKTGLNAMVLVNNMPSIGKDIDLPYLISLPKFEEVFINALPVEIQEKIDLREASRRRVVVDIRSIFCNIAWKLNFSYTSIGKHLGKDHTTIIHLNRKAESLLETDTGFSSLYYTIADKIKEYYDKDF